MRFSVRLLLLSAMLVPVLPVLSTVSPAPAGAATRTIHLGGVPVALRAGTTQVVTVDHRRGYHATVAYWERSGGLWHRRFDARDGRTGYGGLIIGTRRVQGTGTTPLGTYGLISAFGMHVRRSAWALPYRKVRRGDYWVEDNRSRYYNRYRNKARGGFRWWLTSGENTSERLLDYPRQYEWSIVTSFNRAQVRHRGAGIFLHVNGRGATAGCVSAPRWFVRALMAQLQPTRVPVIAVAR